MAKKIKRLGPIGWFARAFAAGFGAVFGVIAATTLGMVVLLSLVSDEYEVEIPGISLPTNDSVYYPNDGVRYPDERTASVQYPSYEATPYPSVSAPTVSVPSIEAPSLDVPPEPSIGQAPPTSSIEQTEATYR